MIEPATTHDACRAPSARPRDSGAVRRVRQILGRMARERGYQHEVRVLEACRLAERPGWMGAARLGTHEEDHAGIDVVVESDVGKLLVQVKSSLAGRARFERRRRKARIVVVVVGRGESPQEILPRVVESLAGIRDEYLRERARGRVAPKKAAAAKRPALAHADATAGAES